MSRSSAAIALVLLAASPAPAYTVKTSLSEACHEQITGDAFVELTREVAQAEEGVIPIPASETWREIARSQLRSLGVDAAAMSETQQFVLLSLVVGVRATDTDGHSLMNLQSVRSVHADPSAEGQYGHCLRGREDDRAEGDANALAGARRAILGLVAQASDHFKHSSGAKRIIKVPVYLDFYGQIELQVYAPFFYVGGAVHALQDSFAHTIRSDEDGLHKVVTVLNYVDAISTEFDEARDGLAHSNSMDHCARADAADLTAAARSATRDLVLAVRRELTEEAPAAVEAVLDDWLTLRPGCTLADDYCGNARWLAIVREDQTGPYVASFLGCSTAGVASEPGSSASLALLVGAWAVARRRRRSPAP